MPNTTTSTDYPLHVAAQNGDLNTLKKLIDSDADINQTNNKRYTPLHIACEHGQLNIVEYLLTQPNINTNARNLDGVTPLHRAVTHEHLAIVDAFANSDIKVDWSLQNASGDSALHMAAQRGLSAIIKTILEPLPFRQRIDLLLAKNEIDGKTPFHNACFQPNPMVFHRLLEYMPADSQGSDIPYRLHCLNMTQSHDYTPLHYAARQGYLELTLYLLLQTADPNRKNVNGDLPLAMAERSTSVEAKAVVELLKSWQFPTNIQTLLGGGDALLQVEPTGVQSHYFDALKAAHGGHDKAVKSRIWQKCAFMALQLNNHRKAALYTAAAEAVISTTSTTDIGTTNTASNNAIQYSIGALRNLVIHHYFASQQLTYTAPLKDKLPNWKTHLYQYREQLKIRIKEPQANVRQLLAENTETFRALVEDMTTDVATWLGKPPCEYALIGLGSLSRSEMSPYSDLEFAILIEQDRPQHREYFRHLTRLLELLVIGLGETELKTIGLPVDSPMNDGFCFDPGGNTPLSDYFELITTPEALASLQTSGAEKIYGAMRNALLCATWLCGSQSLAMAYDKVLWTHLQYGIEMTGGAGEVQTSTVHQHHALSLIRNMLAWYRPMPIQWTMSFRLHLKEELLRLLLMTITNLSMYFAVPAKNVWKSLTKLQKKKILSPIGAERLASALEEIYRLRMRVQLHYGHECEHVFYRGQGDDDSSTIVDLRNPFVVNEEDIRTLVSIYNTLIPLHQTMTEFSASNANRKILFEATLLNELHTAVQRNDLDSLRALLHEGADVNQIDTKFNTPLHLACENGQLNTVNIMITLRKNAIVWDLQNINGDSALHIAAQHGHAQIIRLILEPLASRQRIALLLAKNKIDGKTPFHSACFQPNPIVFDHLLNYIPADPQGSDNPDRVHCLNITQNQGYTPLHYSAHHGFFELALYLLLQTANPHHKDVHGNRPQVAAEQSMKVEEASLVANLLRSWQFPVDIQRVMDAGDSLLQTEPAAVKSHYFEALKAAHDQHNQAAESCVWLKCAFMALRTYDHGKDHRGQVKGYNYREAALYATAAKLINPRLPSSTISMSSLHTLIIRYYFADHQLTFAKPPTDELPRWQIYLHQYREQLKIQIKRADIDARKLLADNTNTFRQLIEEMTNEVISWLGEPPCDYALIGLGSLSRFEMSPYSDLEFAILIKQDKPEYREYFKHLTRLLEFLVIGLGETKLKTENTRGLPLESPMNNGFCFDPGGNTPLSDTFELIGTPEMLASLQASGAEKIDGAMRNALTCVTYLTGNRRLTNAYDDALWAHLNTRTKITQVQGRRLHQTYALSLIPMMLRWYRPELNAEKTAIHVKEDLYRLPSMMISNLALYFKILAKNTWERLTQLKKKGIFSPEGARHLAQVMDEISLLRLQIHLHYGHEYEEIFHRRQTSSDKGKVDDIKNPFEISENVIQRLTRIYQTLMPFYRAMKIFIENHTNRKILFKATLFDDELSARAQLAAHRGNIRVAQDYYQQALAIQPSNVNLHEALAHTYAPGSSEQINGLETVVTLLLRRTDTLVESLARAHLQLALSMAYSKSFPIYEAMQQHWIEAISLLKREPCTFQDSEKFSLFLDVLCSAAPISKLPELPQIMLLTSLICVAPQDADWLSMLNIDPSQLLLPAIRYRSQELIDFLLAQRVDFEYADKRGNTALDYSLTVRTPPSLFIQLINAGAGRKLSVSNALRSIKRLHSVQNISEAVKLLAMRNSEINWKLALTAFLTSEPEESQAHTKIIGTHSGMVYLTLNAKKQVLDKTGNFRQKRGHGVEIFGRRTVIATQINDHHLHFKENPEMPGVEYAVCSLTHRLFNRGMPHHELFKFTNRKGTPYPVLVSETIHGENLQTVFQETERAQHLMRLLDPESLSEMMIVSLLINPEDGKPDNFILSQDHTKSGDRITYRLISIDNDHAFVEPVLKKRTATGLHSELQVKSIIFCLDQMQEPLHPKVVNFLLQLDPYQLLSEWLEDLRQQQQRYRELFNEKECKYFFKKSGPILIPIPFLPGSIAKLYEKFSRLQLILAQSPTITALGLLRRLEPLLGIHYQKVFKSDCNGPKYRFDQLCGEYYSKAIAGCYGTKVDSQQMLRSMNIPQSTASGLTSRDCHSLEQAIAELVTIHSQTQQIKHARSALLKQDSKPFTDLLLDDFKEKVINGIQFDLLDQKQQYFILMTLSKTKTQFWRLSLAYCDSLDKKLLNTILQQSPNLHSLDVSHCDKLGDDLFKSLLKSSSGIERLTAPYLSKLQVVQAPYSILKPRSKRRILLPNLTYLDLHGCEHLSTLKLTAPNLRNLFLNDNESLVTMLIRTPNQLRRVDLSSTSIMESTVVSLLHSQDELHSLRLANCTHIQHMEFLTQFPAIAGHPWGHFHESTIKHVVNALHDYAFDSKLNHTLNRYIHQHFSLTSSTADLLIQLAHDSAEPFQLAVITTLEQTEIPSQPVITMLRQALRNSSSNIRTAAALALGQLKTSSHPIVTALIERLKNDPSVEVQVAAANALGILQVPSGLIITALERACKNPDPNVQIAATNALTQLGQRSLTRTMATVNQSTSETDHRILSLSTPPDPAQKKQTTLDTLSESTPNSLTESLAKELKHQQSSNTSISKNALNTLTALGSCDTPSRNVIGVLIQALKLARGTTDPETAQVRTQAAAALGQLGAPFDTVINTLIETLHDPVLSVQIAAVRALGELFSPKIFSAQLRRIIDTHSNKVQMPITIAAAAADDDMKDTENLVSHYEHSRIEFFTTSATQQNILPPAIHDSHDDSRDLTLISDLREKPSNQSSAKKPTDFQEGHTAPDFAGQCTPGIPEPLCKMIAHAYLRTVLDSNAKTASGGSSTLLLTCGPNPQRRRQNLLKFMQNQLKISTPKITLSDNSSSFILHLENETAIAAMSTFAESQNVKLSPRPAINNPSHFFQASSESSKSVAFAAGDSPRVANRPG